MKWLKYENLCYLCSLIYGICFAFELILFMTFSKDFIIIAAKILFIIIVAMVLIFNAKLLRKSFYYSKSKAQIIKVIACETAITVVVLSISMIALSELISKTNLKIGIYID